MKPPKKGLLGKPLGKLGKPKASLPRKQTTISVKEAGETTPVAAKPLEMPTGEPGDQTALANLRECLKNPMELTELAARVLRIEESLVAAGYALPSVLVPRKTNLPIKDGRLELTPEDLELANFDTLLEIQTLVEQNYGEGAGVTEQDRKKPRLARQKIVRLLGKLGSTTKQEGR